MGCAAPFPGKDNLSRVNGLWGGDFDEKAAFQVVSDKILDDTGNAKPGSGEFNQKIHCCNLNQIGGMNVIFLKEIINKLPGCIGFVKKHQCAGIEQIQAGDLCAHLKIVEIAWRTDENILDSSL